MARLFLPLPVLLLFVTAPIPVWAQLPADVLKQAKSATVYVRMSAVGSLAPRKNRTAVFGYATGGERSPRGRTLSVVIPTLNEEAELPETLARAGAIPEVEEIIVVARRRDGRAGEDRFLPEVILVDDGRV